MAISSSDRGLDQERQRLANWNYHFDIVKQMSDVSSEQKLRILDGMKQLRTTMGSEWLKDAVEMGHPILITLANQAPCARYQLADLGKKLTTLSDVPNFDRLKQMLANKELFSSAIAEVEIAARMKMAGFSTKLYPRADSKESDIRVNVDGQDYFIEITVMRAPHEERKAHRTFDDLGMSFLMDSRASIAGKIYKTLSRPSIRRLQEKIRKSIDIAVKEKRCIEIYEPRVIDYFICPNDKQDEIQEWIKKKRLTGTIVGPPVYVDEPRRIRQTFVQKYRQLPKNEPGLIVIYGHNLFLGLREKSFRNLSELLEETIYELDRLIGGVIVSTYLGVRTPEIKVKETPSYVFRRNFDANTLSQEDVLIIKNRHSEFPINEKLLRAF